MQHAPARHQPSPSARTPAPAAPPAAPSSLAVVTTLDVPMPMRDGTILRANVFRPAGDQACPALLVRTPYGKGGPGGYDRFVRAGYAVVVQDMRGRYTSDGDFVPFLVPVPQEAQDGYDSVEWLAAQPWCDGQVGTMGTSYQAWAQWMLAKLRPPHLKAMSAQSIPPELADVDYPGAFRPARRVHWLMTAMAPDLRRRAGAPAPHRPSEAIRLWEETEHGRWLNLLPWSELPNHLPAPLAGPLKAWLRDPAQPRWRFAEAYGQIDVPNLDITGWYDHCNASIRHLPGMQQDGRTPRAREQSRLVIGPWNHVTLGQATVGTTDFGGSAAVDLTDLLVRWFDRWLKGQDNGVDREPAVSYFMLGANQWRSAPTWPPPAHADHVLHLRQGRGLTPEPPRDEEPEDRYTYDPRDPAPTLWSPRLFTEPVDRRVLDHRPDILRYATAPLDEALEVVGEPTLVLFAASSALDTDFFARLVDEAPDGPALELCSGMVRARHRHGLDRAEPLTPETLTELRIRLGPIACRFGRGHRIRLEVTSSDFPNYDRNHNTGGNDLFDTTLVVARQRVAHTPHHPSRLMLPVQDSHALR